MTEVGIIAQFTHIRDSAQILEHQHSTVVSQVQTYSKYHIEIGIGRDELEQNVSLTMEQVNGAQRLKGEVRVKTFEQNFPNS